MICSRVLGRSLSAGLLVLAVAATPALAAHLDNPNQLVDASFEGAPTFDGAPFVGSWEGFSSGPGAGVGFSGAMPRTGAQSAELVLDNVSNAFVGTFQDVNLPAASIGQPAWFSGWHKLGSGAGGSEYRIEWRDAAGDEIGRLQLADSPGTEFEEFIVNDIIPAGASFARLVYAVQSFGGPPSQQVFVDDVNFNFAAVPEPTSALLLLVGGLGMIGLRRRS